MAKKTDTVAKRWEELIGSGVAVKAVADLKKFEENIDADVVEKKIDPTVVATLPDLEDVSWILDAKSLVGQSVNKAFAQAGLDPKNPIHWKILVYLFAFAHFGQWPGRGRQREWTGQRYAQLKSDFQKVRDEKPTISSIEVCRILKKRHGDRYGCSAERLDKEVKKAYDPKFNTTLAPFVDMSLLVEKAVFIKRGLTWSQNVEAEKRNIILKFLQELRGRQKAKARAPATSNGNGR
jgi:hypothetical protein